MVLWIIITCLYMISISQMPVPMATREDDHDLTVDWLLAMANNLSSSEAHSDQTCKRNNNNRNQSILCLGPCKCFSDCLESRMCCLDAYTQIDELDVLRRQHEESTYKCIDPLLNADIDKSDSFQSSSSNNRKVSLIAACPRDSTDQQTQYAQLCLVDYLTIWTYFGIENGIPVTEKQWPFRSFKNIFCARCHGVDKDDEAALIPWMVAYSSVEADFWEHLDDSNRDNRNGINTLLGTVSKHPQKNNMKFFPPDELIDVINLHCGIDKCNLTGLWKRYNADTERACLSFMNPYWSDDLWYRNIFCFQCNTDKPDLTCNGMRIDDIDYFSYMAVIDYTFVTRQVKEKDVEETPLCKPGQFRDLVMDICRDVHCSALMFYDGTECRPIYPKVNHQLIRISIDYRADPPQTLFSSSFIQKVEIQVAQQVFDLCNEINNSSDTFTWISDITFNYDINVLYEYDTFRVVKDEVQVNYIFIDVFLAVYHVKEGHFYDLLRILNTNRRFLDIEYITDDVFTRMWNISRFRTINSIPCFDDEYLVQSAIQYNLLSSFRNLSQQIYQTQGHLTVQNIKTLDYPPPYDKESCFFTGLSSQLPSTWTTTPWVVDENHADVPNSTLLTTLASVSTNSRSSLAGSAIISTMSSKISASTSTKTSTILTKSASISTSSISKVSTSKSSTSTSTSSFFFLTTSPSTSMHLDPLPTLSASIPTESTLTQLQSTSTTNTNPSTKSTSAAKFLNNPNKAGPPTSSDFLPTTASTAKSDSISSEANSHQPTSGLAPTNPNPDEPTSALSTLASMKMTTLSTDSQHAGRSSSRDEGNENAMEEDNSFTSDERTVSTTPDHLLSTFPTGHFETSKHLVTNANIPIRLVSLRTIFSQTWSPERENYIAIDSLTVCPQIQLDQSEYETTQTGIFVPYLNISVPSKYVKYLAKPDFAVRICIDFVQDATKIDDKLFKRRNDSKEQGTPSSNTVAKVVLSYTCTGLSSICLFLTLLIFSMNKSLRTTPGILIMFLSTSLLLNQLLYMIANTLQIAGPGCKVIGVVMHFSLVSYFFWMNISCFHMMHLLDTSGGRFLGLRHKTVARLCGYSCYVFGSSSLCILANVTYSLTTSQATRIGYGGPLCYIQHGIMVGLTVALPLGIILVANLAMFIRAIISVSQTDISTESFGQRYFIIFSKLSTLTGLTWALAFLAQWTGLEVFEYMFIVLNGGQGVFIFLAFVANKRVFNIMKSNSGTG